jgi:hypothetical protein
MAPTPTDSKALESACLPSAGGASLQLLYHISRVLSASLDQRRSRSRAATEGWVMVGLLGALGDLPGPGGSALELALSQRSFGAFDVEVLR